jgi:PleD family two-component response regulator
VTFVRLLSGRDAAPGERESVKILVIDDHPLIREALRQVLQALDG